MTKKELIEALKDIPEDTNLGVWIKFPDQWREDGQEGVIALKISDYIMSHCQECKHTKFIEWPMGFHDE